MDGRHRGHANRDRTKEVLGASSGRSHKPSRRAVCQFLLEEVFCRYGCVGLVIADRRKLDSDKAREFFTTHGFRLTLTTTYNLEVSGKIERGHSLIVKAHAKACGGRVKDWPHMLPYALWADRTTHSYVIGYMPAELMIRQTPVMPMETAIATWTMVPWKEEMSRE